MAIRRLILLPLLLGGCAGTSAVPAESLRDSLDASRASLRAVQGERATPNPPAPIVTPAMAAPVAHPPPLGRQAPAAVAALMQQTAEAVRAALGEPSLRRAEGADAEIWLYEAPDCRLDLVLYRDPGQPWRVAHAQARSAGMAAQTEGDCLRAIAGGSAGGRALPAASLPRA